MSGFAFNEEVPKTGRWEKFDRLDESAREEVKRFPPHNASPRCKHASLGVERH